MKKKLLIPFFLLLVSSVHAQLNNSWIDYNKTYYKFHVGKDTLCRIPQTLLASIGLQGATSESFQLWRNGQQVRIYITTPTGPLTSGDYIEFWGEMNDGKSDNQLYRDPATFQLADRYSLESDTASYFLTINPAGGNLRYTNAVNPSPGAATPDAYFMRKVDLYYKQQICRGKAEVVGEYIYSSAYEDGEGWTSFDVAPCCDFTQEIFGLNVYSAGPQNSLSVRTNVFGNANNLRNLRVKIFQNVIYSNPMPYFVQTRVNLTNLPISLLQSPDYVPIYINDSSDNVNDRLVVATIGITYPAKFNFNNQRDFYFELEPSATGNYLSIDNVNYGSLPPVLYDMTTGSRYIGDITTIAGKVGFVLPAYTASVRQFRLMNQEVANVNIIRDFTTRNFLDFANTSLQGDYMIISNQALYNDGNGNNYVDQYKQYRNTTGGGGFNTKIYNIDELTDQFGFGIKGHPGSIRDFIRYSNQQFAVKPKYVFLIGRGMNYMEQKAHETDPLCDKLNFVPTFGWPASDVLLASPPGMVGPITPIGRLSVINGTEINNYLQKIIQYEQVQQNPQPSIASMLWMKDVIHVAGGKDSLEGAAFLNNLDSYKAIVENDTSYGGHVETFNKTSTGAVQQASSNRIEQLINNGVGFIGYFGHSSASTFEFNLSDPQIYTNAGKYPFFNASGCNAGNFFIFDQLRLTGNLSLSEKYVLANQRGSIGFLADTHFGIPPFLNIYNLDYYGNFCRVMYGNTVGNQIQRVIKDVHDLYPDDYYTRVHLEEITLHGDPALKINSFGKPDYVVEDQLVQISPTIISVADASFDVKVKMANIGKVVNDSIWVSVKRKLPNDTIQVLFNRLIPGIKYMDSLDFPDVHINPVTDKGLNQIIVSLDYTGRVDETFETNNTVTKDFYIFEDELKPSFPYNFSIINQQNITFTANTANPLSGDRQYVMELDTTELFNSAFKKTYNKSGIGGLVEFTPTNVTFTDSTVYYWRVAMVPTASAPYIWNGYSFVYLPNSSTGFNQSHYYQHLKDNFTNIDLGSDRKFAFQQIPRSLTIRTGLYPYFNYDKINVNLDFDQLELYGCVYNAIQFYVFDSTTLLPWRNRNSTFTGNTPTAGRFGSYPVCMNSATPYDTTRAFFEFPYSNPGGKPYRKRAMDFIDSIPNGMYVAITNIGDTRVTPSFIDTWKNDTLTYGPGNSLYHKLKSVGFTQIDSFYHHLPFLYFFRKGVNSFTPTTVIGPKDSSYVDESFNLNSTNTKGLIESPVYGPAAKWTALHWRGTTSDPQFVDKVNVQVWGIKQNGTMDSLATVAPSQDTSLAFVDAAVYPNIKLKMVNNDSIYVTPFQLKYLRVNADYVPEGAVAPNILYKMKDSVEQGEKIDFAVAFKNISQTKFDSMMKIKMNITDRNNLTTTVTIPKGKILIAGDTLSVSYTIDTKNYPGNNILFLEFNPDNDQKEQYHFNNVLYKGFYAKEDKFNPLLDVTFDGTHILNKDIVSAKPAILIKLKDESRFLELKDTSLIKLQVRYPDQSLHTYYFGDTMHFNPANLSTGENTASIDFRPYFPDDGEYELIVSGKDVVGNTAGSLDFHVMFTVINKPMISNLLNYPNPFTTSTAFVFTVTGSQIPQNIRIQILTITGKIVREITMSELGPIRIGRNITEFKWDGTDMYGQKLANGVYIYRVLTNLNGKSLDKFKADGDNTDKYFNKGYGKMYLMR